ncbi:1-(5-phosphoribosyl)-5-[(5-phosphoribosylamino)methylideneamino] imidazole-4-carboxamide isomerase [Acetomicrobium hydrogeniformans]|uniref:1-(5-phosphoribosyl)-5-[(5-phosphoribosylamino)methylideneamino] imidazole-4-carboxamide isomerase n=1 Tax=Acetomicrobium hydrogeniformans TaxID=649746 RepID=A0A7V7BYY0_9BACT|nr:1-(5-phosphoribosyl)-5-[(5-phosphoribosylamino)methylideneamino] imidazole-4-carboxamide isomerase [Acetomicrobium hydrogeniformans]HHZ05086.1 1-(5-phosphoribosyl)-5-[(5-phosphoribosylamino)methylideneamino] imidazole-4-carboxamide isomerase [Acetomicrobium hydrogeniformans]
MKIYPAIDLYEGKVVRLYQGDFDRSWTISGDPLQVARALKEMGAREIHVVDLEGAKEGSPKNIGLLPKLKEVFQVIHFGGGLRSPAEVQKALEMGADKAMVGSLIWTEGAEEIRNLAPRIIPALDVKQGKVALAGWLKTVPLNPLEAVKNLSEMGFETILATATERDGTKEGPDLALYSALVENPDMNIIAAGGIGSIEDVKALKELGLFGAVIGKALYDGSLDLKKVLEEVEDA